MTSRVHYRPPTGPSLLPCCGRDANSLPTAARTTECESETTCTDRRVAELVVDTDGGESPFGWSEPATP